MKTRTAKKHAKMFWLGKKKYPIKEDVFIYTSNDDYCVKMVAMMPERVRRELYTYALRMGWRGCHWDAPDVVDTTFPPSYEEDEED